MARAATLLSGLALLATSGRARAERGEVSPDDPDAVAEHRSEFWEHAIDPDGHAAEAALAELIADAGYGADGDALDAGLASLIARFPAQLAPRLFRIQRLHGLGTWSACAADATTARAIVATADAALGPDDVARIADCLARTGAEADRSAAVALLRDEVAAGRSTAALITSLGETLLASARPEQAADVLREISDAHPPATWLMALALDASGDTDGAADAFRAAFARDSNMTYLERPAVPWIDPRMRLLARGLGHAATRKPSRAAVYLRAYLAHRDAPRRDRVALVLTQVLAAPIDDSLELTGTSGGVAATLTRPLHASLPACFANTPLISAVIEVDAIGPAPVPVVTSRTAGQLRVDETTTETLTSVKIVTVTTNLKTGSFTTRTTQRAKVVVGRAPPAGPALRVRVLDQFAVPIGAAATDEAVRQAIACAQRSAATLTLALPPSTWLRLVWTVAGGVDGGAEVAVADPPRRRAKPRATR